MLKDIICFDPSCRNKLGFSQNSVYWTSKGMVNRIFDKDYLGKAVTLLIKNCYFSVGNTISLSWQYFLYHFEAEHITSLVSTRSKVPYNFHLIRRFIDDLCVINDRNFFLDNFTDIYPISTTVVYEILQATTNVVLWSF